ncbi:unnamed protein product (macronuclear) [Paramecium tetraurelia]|uniref:Uncharacterized protein n=1 Tax=Paramecium tetraurelia TaxID=5888 RepID=A0CME3_PARTE|nr:uncharacterized protein GSPATT00008439001 [Paramecium tetraurelia]CAK71960.1 unnamed protein product [Paramecium tetraurelia]|eukprot:XP_001439357.1 hypothetical protein (macronuclear) [Paramecium tetraurelia strain d4-2]
MNKKITLLLLMACVVCMATLMFSFSTQDGELKMKKSHSFSSSKNHEWMDIGHQIQIAKLNVKMQEE